eukprot:2642031-Amphidinium_carterae.1
MGKSVAHSMLMHEKGVVESVHEFLYGDASLTQSPNIIKGSDERAVIVQVKGRMLDSCGRSDYLAVSRVCKQLLGFESNQEELGSKRLFRSAQVSIMHRVVERGYPFDPAQQDLEAD